MNEDLDIARELISWGLPVFVAKPAPNGGTGNTGFYLPRGWETTQPDNAILNRWRPGDALCLVMGWGFDLVDCDPRNGSDPSRAAWNEDGIMPRVYAAATTPSGGTHELIASLGIHSRDNVALGIDVKAGKDGKGHGFAFIAPTVKRSKVTGDLVAYQWVTKPTRPDPNDRTGARLIALVNGRRNRAELGNGTGTIPLGQRHEIMLAYTLQLRQEHEYEDALPIAHARAADCEGTWDPAETVRLLKGAYDQPAAPKFYDRSDVGNARRARDSFGGNLRYSPALGWLWWNGGHWDKKSKEAVVGLVINHTDDMLKASEDDDNRKWEIRSRMMENVGKCVSALASLPGVLIEVDQLDTNPDLLTVGNGTIELRTGTLREARKADYITMAVQVPYDPGARCPKWSAFLESCQPGREEIIGYLQRLVGYGITGRIKEQCFVILEGNGANGKSTFTDALYRVFGGISKAASVETFMQNGNRQGAAASPDVAVLRAARMVFTSEADHGSKMAEGRIKLLTGGDPVTARHLNKDLFEFVPQMLLFISSNALPEIRGRDKGIWRRVKRVEWLEDFTDRKDMDLPDTLAAEDQGILAWAVEGARQWYDAGLQEPDTVTEAVFEYRADQDILDGFLPGRVNVDPDGFMARATVYNMFKEWCDQEGAMRPWSSKQFFLALRQRGIEEHKKVGTRGFKLG